MARSAPGSMGEEPFSVWQKKHPDVGVCNFRAAASEADLVVNATNGAGALAALDAAGPESLGSKIVVDVSNPLDFSRGFPPSLLVANTDSLAEQIQRRFPDARVVKTLNTVTASLMVDPGALANGEHDIFISGNDASAKAEVTGILNDGLGWRHVIDLGDITTARGTEMLLPLWLRLMGVLERPIFNFHVVT